MHSEETRHAQCRSEFQNQQCRLAFCRCVLCCIWSIWEITSNALKLKFVVPSTTILQDMQLQHIYICWCFGVSPNRDKSAGNPDKKRMANPGANCKNIQYTRTYTVRLAPLCTSVFLYIVGRALATMVWAGTAKPGRPIWISLYLCTSQTIPVVGIADRYCGRWSKTGSAYDSAAPTNLWQSL